MITGSVDADGHLSIRIQISDGSPPYREVDALIATDLEAELALPGPLITVLRLRLIGGDSLEIGDDVQDTPSYVAYLQWHRGLIPVIAVESPETQPLVGRGLLRGSFLRADFMDGGVVALYSID